MMFGARIIKIRRNGIWRKKGKYPVMGQWLEQVNVIISTNTRQIIWKTYYTTFIIKSEIIIKTSY